MSKRSTAIAAVFLDRDGVINEEVEYLSDSSKLRLVPGSARAIRLLNERAIPVIVVTNQSGVARGYYPESRIAHLHHALDESLKDEGAHIDRFYYCPHHPEGLGKYRIDCECRKPKPGLLHEAAKDFSLNLKNCIIIGDKASDIGAGIAAGCRTILVMTGYGKKELASWNQPFQPGHVAEDLQGSVEWLLRD
ncbi:MAG: HAD family hydrolase [bacterium]|nr:HAD family hydrolase [bacterium]